MFTRAVWEPSRISAGVNATRQCGLRCGEPTESVKDKFAALSIRKGHKKSIVALAHKMLRIVFAVLKNKTPCLDKAVDCEALSVQRNAPRWLKMLIKHGYRPTAA